MASNLQTGSEPSLAALATGIINDVQALFRQQIQLLKHEFEVSIHRAAEGAGALVAGIGLTAVGGVVFVFGLVYLLNWLLPSLPLWACYMIVGALLVIPGACLTFFAARTFRAVGETAEEAGETLKENLEWTTKPK